MSVVPVKTLEKIQWAEYHITPFTTNAVAIGTTVVEATAFDTKTQAARAALTAAEAARSASKDATITLKAAIAALDVSAAGIVKQVRVKAETTNNPGVYALASIPAPATPSPMPAPEKPTDLVVILDETGFLNLSWKCNTLGGGVIYQVWRRIDGATLEYLGGVGEKEFVDNTLPAGSKNVVYQLQAARPTAVSPWAMFNVNFGVSSGGTTFVASVTEESPAKIAA